MQNSEARLWLQVDQTQVKSRETSTSFRRAQQGPADHDGAEAPRSPTHTCGALGTPTGFPSAGLAASGAYSRAVIANHVLFYPPADLSPATHTVRAHEVPVLRKQTRNVLKLVLRVADGNDDDDASRATRTTIPE